PTSAEPIASCPREPQIILHHSDRFTFPIAMNQLVGLCQQQYGTLMAGTLSRLVLGALRSYSPLTFQQLFARWRQNSGCSSVDVLSRLACTRERARKKDIQVSSLLGRRKAAIGGSYVGQERC